MRPAPTVTDRNRLHALPRGLAAVAMLLVVGLLVAGCGGGSKSPGVASVSTTTTSTSHSSSSTDDGGGGTALSGGGAANSPGGGGSPHSGFAIATGNPQKALELSECMRANGEPNFPDPNAQGVIQGTGLDPSSPSFQRAQQKCATKLGGGKAPSPAQQAAAEAAALKFSQCMRAHGEPDFPDPQFSSGGGVSIKIGAKGGGNSGLDPNSPIFQKAQKTCGSLLPGRPNKSVGT